MPAPVVERYPFPVMSSDGGVSSSEARSELQLGRSNQAIKRLRRLVVSKEERYSQRTFVLEGSKVISAALSSNAHLEQLYVAPSAWNDPAALEVIEVAELTGCPVATLRDGVMEKIASSITPQPLIALAQFVDVPLERVFNADLVVISVDLGIPGNLGSSLRCADAAGADAFICTGNDSADIYNPKTVRASAGSIFNLPVVIARDPLDVLRRLRARGVKTFAAVAHGGKSPMSMPLQGKIAITVGNEARGLPLELNDSIDSWLTIPMLGKAESLNVASALAVVLFEVARQRGRLIGH